MVSVSHLKTKPPKIWLKSSHVSLTMAKFSSDFKPKPGEGKVKGASRPTLKKDRKGGALAGNFVVKIMSKYCKHHREKSQQSASFLGIRIRRPTNKPYQIWRFRCFRPFLEIKVLLSRHLPHLPASRRRVGSVWSRAAVGKLLLQAATGGKKRNSTKTCPLVGCKHPPRGKIPTKFLRFRQNAENSSCKLRNLEIPSGHMALQFEEINRSPSPCAACETAWWRSRPPWGTGVEWIIPNQWSWSISEVVKDTTSKCNKPKHKICTRNQLKPWHMAQMNEKKRGETQCRKPSPGFIGCTPLIGMMLVVTVMGLHIKLYMIPLINPIIVNDYTIILKSF